MRISDWSSDVCSSDLVNYRTGAQAFYLPDGSSVALPANSYEGPVNAAFDAAGMETLVRWAQSGEPAYSYPVFSEQAKRAGCAGYLVSFSGRRVVYYGRTAETHVDRKSTRLNSSH